MQTGDARGALRRVSPAVGALCAFAGVWVGAAAPGRHCRDLPPRGFAGFSAGLVSLCLGEQLREGETWGWWVRAM